MNHVKDFNTFLKENVTISNPDSPEYRLNEYVDGILEDIQKIMDSITNNPDINPKQINMELSGLYNMIINDSHHVFNPQQYQAPDTTDADIIE